MRAAFIETGQRVLCTAAACLAAFLYPTFTAAAAAPPAPSESVHVTRVTVTAGGAAVFVDTMLTCRNPGVGVFVFTLNVAQNIGGGTVWTAGGSAENYVINPVPCDGQAHQVPYLMSAADSFPAAVNSGPTPRWRAKPLVVDANFSSTIVGESSDVRAWPGAAGPVSNSHVGPVATLVQHGTVLRLTARLACPTGDQSQVVAAVSQVGTDGQVRGGIAGGVPAVCNGAPHTYVLLAPASQVPWHAGTAAVQVDDTRQPWGLYQATVTVTAG